MNRFHLELPYFWNGLLVAFDTGYLSENHISTMLE